MKNCEMPGSWKTRSLLFQFECVISINLNTYSWFPFDYRLDWLVLDFKKQSQSFELSLPNLNRRRKNITKLTISLLLCAVPIDWKATPLPNQNCAVRVAWMRSPATLLHQQKVRFYVSFLLFLRVILDFDMRMMYPFCILFCNAFREIGAFWRRRCWRR